MGKKEWNYELNERQRRQGDVFFEKMGDLEFLLDKERDGKDFAPIKNPNLVEGEATNHFHAVIEADKDKVEILDEEKFRQFAGECYLKVKEPCTIIHPEHGKVKLDKGIWRMDIQRQHNYEKDMEEKVRD